MSNDFTLKDSGKREEWDTGSKRDTREGKGRFDLIPTGPLRELAIVYERGAIKYGDNNWRKGQPLQRYVDSALRHINMLVAGDDSENHAMQAAWNMFAYRWTLTEIEAGRLPAELDDRLPPEPQYERELDLTDYPFPTGRITSTTYPPDVKITGDVRLTHISLSDHEF